MSIPFNEACTLTVAGPSRAGKSVWVAKLLKHKNVMYKVPVDKVLYCYQVFQPGFDVLKKDIQGIEFHQGLPENVEEFSKSASHGLIILDDLMNDVICSKTASSLYIYGSHHFNVSVIFITHNLFAQGSAARVISLNTNYICLFKSVRDASSINFLGRQIYPENSKALIEAYRDATSENYGYLILDLTSCADEELRLRTNIFPSENTIVYVPKNYKRPANNAIL